MTVALIEKTRVSTDPRVVLRDLDWEGYESILKIRGERSTPRLVYLDGSLYFMSPSYPHERIAERLGRFIEHVTEELDLPCIASGHTTFRRGSERGGVEGDKTFFLASAARIRGKAEINLEVDPPPDLAVEVVWTHAADEAVEVYRRLGVPEVWIVNDRGITILVLQPSGDYEPAESSRAVPVSAAEIHQWATKESEDDTAWAKVLRPWVRETLAPRLKLKSSSSNLD